MIIFFSLFFFLSSGFFIVICYKGNSRVPDYGWRSFKIPFIAFSLRVRDNFVSPTDVSTMYQMIRNHR